MSANTKGFLDFTVETARDMMSPIAHPVDPGWKIEQGVKALLETGRPSVPVISENKLIGTLRRADILRLERLTGKSYLNDRDRRWFSDGAEEDSPDAVRFRRLNGDTRVRDVMGPALEVSPDELSSRVADLLIDHWNEVVYVVNGSAPIGQIATIDMLNHLRPSNP